VIGILWKDVLSAVEEVNEDKNVSAMEEMQVNQDALDQPLDLLDAALKPVQLNGVNGETTMCAVQIVAQEHKPEPGE